MYPRYILQQTAADYTDQSSHCTHRTPLGRADPASVQWLTEAFDPTVCSCLATLVKALLWFHVILLPLLCLYCVSVPRRTSRLCSLHTEVQVYNQAAAVYRCCWHVHIIVGLPLNRQLHNVLVPPSCAFIAKVDQAAAAQHT